MSPARQQLGVRIDAEVIEWINGLIASPDFPSTKNDFVTGLMRTLMRLIESFEGEHRNEVIRLLSAGLAPGLVARFVAGYPQRSEVSLDSPCYLRVEVTASELTEAQLGLIQQYPTLWVLMDPVVPTQSRWIPTIEEVEAALASFVDAGLVYKYDPSKMGLAEAIKAANG